MKRTAYFLCFVFLSMLLISCSTIQQKLSGADEWIKPGNKVGKMTVEQGSPALPYPNLWYFCEYMPDEHEPVVSTSECDVPQMSGMTVQFGWLSKESKFTSNWDAITWGLTMDGVKVDLEAFEWQEFDYIAHGENNKSRQWLINLRNLSPGKHTLQLSQTLKIAVDDGFNVYHPGIYEYRVHYTVLKKTVYPPLPSTVVVGQHPYTSKKANLDFLLYLPDDYGKDPQQAWPLIVYLHGASLRGTTLELLMKEPLPKKLGKENNFPFIVVSPLGDGEYEFWAKDAMIQPLFELLDEIQKKYSIDSKRIYLTGNDMGGNGVWTIGLRRPEYFAALAPVAGYASYPFEVPENICDLKDVPVWAFHGERDEFVPAEVEQDLVDALTACGGNAQITISPEMKNDVPYKVYDNPELFEWFLSQSLK
jgi:predicted esterase